MVETCTEMHFLTYFLKSSPLPCLLFLRPSFGSFFDFFATLIGDLFTTKCPEESATSWNEVFTKSSFSSFSLYQKMVKLKSKSKVKFLSLNPKIGT